jgi:hypothetical protein
VVWIGVSVYLTRSAIDRTLADLNSICAHVIWGSIRGCMTVFGSGKGERFDLIGNSLVVLRSRGTVTLVSVGALEGSVG